MTDPSPTVHFVDVSPAMARQWLPKNVRNRKLRPIAISRYRSDMIAGRWLFTGDAIRFDVAGNLLDGQHRLLALEGCPENTRIRFLVITKLPTESQNVMDQGIRRTPGDQLGLHGIKDANVVAAGARLFMAHESGLLFKDAHAQQSSVTTVAIEEWVRTNPDLVEAANTIPNHRLAACPPSVSFCAAMLFVDRIGVEFATEFFRLLHAGTGEGHPINTLDRRLRRIKDSKIKTTPRDFLALFIQAMNAWLDDRTVTKFQLPRGAKWTDETFPRLRRIA